MSYDNPPPPPPPQYGAPVPGAVPGNNKKALWSLVLGIVGLVCCGLVAGIPAIILANMAKKEISTTGEGGGGMATAGLVLGIIACVWSVINLILAVSGNGLYDFS